MIYREFKDAVVKYAVENAVTDYELYYEESESTKAEIFREEVKGYSSSNAMGICFRCIVDGKTGYASTENMTEEEAKSLVLRAMDNAGSIESEEESFIHKQGDNYAVCGEEKEAAPNGSEIIDMALALQRELYRADGRVTDGTQSAAAHIGETYAICNSNGLDLEDKVSYDACYCLPLVEADGEMYDGFADRRGNRKEFDLKALAGKAVEDAVSCIGAGSVASGKYTVLISGKAMATLLGTFSSVFSAEQAQKGMSLLAGKEGENIAAEGITIVDDPRYEDSAAKRTFDGEGVAAYAKNVVEKGRLVTLLHNLKTAARAGVKSTGNASKTSYAAVVGVSPFTFYISSGEGTKEELFSAAGEGIYVTEVTGLHAGANPVTGDFSLSSKGFLVKAGRKDAPVKNFTISGNFFALLKEIERTGADLEFVNGRFGSPTVMVRDMAVRERATARAT